MSKAKTNNLPLFTQPFPGPYPHIILYNGDYYELACPLCDGNARGDSPHKYFSQAKGFVQHINKKHDIDGTISVHEFITNYDHRELTDEEVALIRAGYGSSVIERKPMNTKMDGKKAQVKVAHDESAPIEAYPMVVKKKDGTYIELACCFCDGNARTARGANGMKDPKLVFLTGPNGLLSHISQSHKEEE